MRNEIAIQTATAPPLGTQPIEIVERKGLGHPDSICDALMDSVSVALCAAYQQTAGRILHHNVDKSLLVAGQSTPALGGGRIDAPLKLIFGDRATAEWNGVKIPVGEIAEATARKWIRDHLRFVDPDNHVAFQNEIRPGSPELTDIFARTRLTANDTSAAVGYAPLSETEQLVIAAERYLHSPPFKVRFPAAGEDVKVMAVRRGRVLSLTVALAFVDRFIADATTYFARKAEIAEDLRQFLAPRLRELDRVDIALNTLDDPSRGEGGMYLTVLGTAAEGADGGEVGRGNRVNGVIALHRPMGTEAAAGKNPVSHVGKIYSVLSHQLAGKIHADVPGVEEVYVWLCSQIGQPLDEPWILSVDLALASGAGVSDVAPAVRQVVEQELGQMEAFTAKLIRGEFPIC
jgi:S-adenosylmethionine synthetase